MPASSGWAQKIFIILLLEEELKACASKNQQQFKLQMQNRKRLLKANRKPLDSFDQAPPAQSNSSNLIDRIQNENLYLKLVAIALEISREAQVSQSALDELENKLLGAKGFQDISMLNTIQNKNEQINSVVAHKKLQSYSSSKKYITSEEQIAFLDKMEKEVSQSINKEQVIFALKKYIQKKKATIIQYASTEQSYSRTKYFLSKIKPHLSKNLQRSNFYGQSIRQILGRIEPKKQYSNEYISKMIHLKTIWGHTFFSEQEQQYCPLFNIVLDNSDKMVITGGQDGKIKVWSRQTGGLISTLQGHKDYINKIAITNDNKILLSAAQDGIRFFDLDKMNSLGGFPIEGIMDIGELVIEDSVNPIQPTVIFANHEKLYVLPTESIKKEGTRKMELYDFKIYNFGSKIFEHAPGININNNNVLTITPKGLVFLGFIGGIIVIFDFHQLSNAEVDSQNIGMTETINNIPQFTLPILSIVNAHEGDILEIKWNPRFSYFSSGAKKDGVCKIWQFKYEDGQTRPIVIKELKIPKYKMKRKRKVYNCNFGCWNSDFTHLVCSFQEQQTEEDSQNRGDGQVLVYNAIKMDCTWQMSKSIELSSIRAMDSHPYFNNIMLICDSYGKIIIVDILQCFIVNIFEERAFHLGHPSFCLVPSQCKFTRDGLSFVVATQYGNYSIYGYDIKQFYEIFPTEQLFENDYQQFQIDPETYHPVTNLDVPVDVNSLNQGEFENMRHQRYLNLKKIDRKNFRKLLHSEKLPKAKEDHINQYRISYEQVERISECYLQTQRNIQIFRQNIEQIENKRMAYLYEERQKREQKLREIIAQKTQKIKQVDQTYQYNLQASNYTSQHNLNNYSDHRNSRSSQYHEAPRRRGRRPGSRFNQSSRPAYFSSNRQQEQEVDYDQEIPRSQQEEQYLVDIQQDEEDDGQSYDHSQEDEDFNEDNQSSDGFIQNRNSRRRLHRNRNQNRTRQTSRRLRARRPANVVIQQLQNEFQEQLNKKNKRLHLQNNSSNQQQKDKSQSLQKQKQKQRERMQIRKIAGKVVTQMKNQRQLCQVCYSKESTVTCFQCEIKWYCDGCKNFRGKKSNQSNRYSCFQCTYNKNTYPELHKNVSFEKYNMNQRTDLFIPQIGDEVAYFFQGYQQFLFDKIEILNNKYLELGKIFDIIPHENHQELTQIQKCRVVEIDFAFPLEQQNQISYRNNLNRGRGRLQKVSTLDILMLVTLIDESGFSFKVFFYPGYEFLIKWEIYEDINKNDRYGKFKMYDIAMIKDQQIQIEQIRPLNQNYHKSMWKNIIVRKSENKYLRRSRDRSDDIPINIWNIEGLVDEKCFEYQSSMTSTLKEKYCERILKLSIEDQSKWEIFCQPVDIQSYKHYYQYVEVGMYFRLIIERLQNNYYASQESFKRDLKLLIQNSISFNSKESQITGWCQQLVSKVLIQESSQNNELEQTQKKSKTKKKVGSASSANNKQARQGNEDVNFRRNQVKVSKFEEQQVKLKRLRKLKKNKQESEQSYRQQSSEQNYDYGHESSEMVKRNTRSKRRKLEGQKKVQVNEHQRMTRSRNKH